MGSANGLAAYALWPELDHGPMRLLVGMSLRALDPPGGKNGRPPYLYYDGEDGLLQITGRSRTATYRLLEVLVSRGAVTLAGAGRLGHKAVYRVNVDASAKASGPLGRVPKNGTRKGPDGRYALCPDGRDERVPMNGTPRTTRTSKDHGKDPSAESVEVVQTAREDSRSKAMEFDEAVAIVDKLGPTEAILRVTAHREDHGCTHAEARIHVAAELVAQRPALRVIRGEAS